MKNHFFIGLGGQGGKSLAELRKVFAQREGDARELREKFGVKHDFLSIDSSPDVWNSGKIWKYFGEDLSLLPSQRLPLERMNSVDTLSLRPDVAPWIGDQSVINSFLSKEDKVPGANQRRRFGRLLFANNADQVRQAITSQVSNLTVASSNQCCFHVFASLGGGTGSGGIVDLVTLLRSQFRDASLSEGFPIFLYLFITELDVGASNVGYFYQNQYTALRDLNALACGKLDPNILGAQASGAKFSGSEPISSISLFSGLNNRNINLPLPTQIRIAAESCFERIYSLVSGGLDQTAQRSITGEDILAVFPGEPMKTERSYRFGSLGMRRWEVPTEKIREMLALDLIASSLSQMLFQHWHAGHGFVNELVPLSGEHVSRVRDQVLSAINERLVSTLRDELHGESRRGVAEIARGTSTGRNENGLEDLEQRVKDFFDTGFRSVGISGFFKGIRGDSQSAISDLYSVVDAILTRNWNDPDAPVGLFQIKALLTSIREALRDRIKVDPSSQETVSRLVSRRNARKREWSKITPLSRMIGKERALLSRHSSDLQGEYDALILAESARVDSELQKALLEKIDLLENQYRVAILTLEKIKGAAERERDEILGELRQMSDRDGANQYEFAFETLLKFRDELRKNEPHQTKAARSLREKTVPSGSNLSRYQFEESRGRMDRLEDEIGNELRKAAAIEVNAIHHEWVASGAISPILNPSLLETLQARYSGNASALQSEAKQFVDLAASSLHLDRNQMAPAVILGGNIGVPPMPCRTMVIGLPRHPFSAALKQAFSEAIHAGVGYNTCVYEHDDPTQLRLLVMDFWMAARFSTSVSALAGKYTNTASQNTQNNLRYFCNIDKNGEDGLRASLFLPTTEELRQKVSAFLWVGARVDDPCVIEDSNGLFLRTKKDGDDEIDPIGKTAAEVAASADYPLMIKINTAVEARLAGIDSATRARLITSVDLEDKRIASESGQTSAAYLAWMPIRKSLKALLS